MLTWKKRSRHEETILSRWTIWESFEGYRVVRNESKFEIIAGRPRVRFVAMLGRRVILGEHRTKKAAFATCERVARQRQRAA